MIFYTVLLLMGLGLVSTLPPRLTLPDLNTSSFEINSLEQDDQSVLNLIDDKQNTIEATIKKVEDLIKVDPTLPRLTRGEILDLLENITTTEQQNLRDPKAIMVVMPYTPSNQDDKNIEDLYTKPPITQMIGDPTDDEDSVINSRKTSKKTNQQSMTTTIKNSNQKDIFVVTTRNPIRTQRPLLSSTVSPEVTISSRPTEIAETTKRRRPLRRRTTTTTQYPPNRYPEITTQLPSDGIQIINSPNLFIPQRPNNDLKIDQNIKYDIYNRNTTPKPLIVSEYVDLPQNFRNVVKDLNLDAAIVENEKPKSSTADRNRIKELLASIGAVTTTTTTTTTGMPDVANVADNLSPDMKDLLMSFGLIPNLNEKPKPKVNYEFTPDKAETHPDSYIGFKPLPDSDAARNDMEALLASFGLGRASRKEKSLKSKTKTRNESQTNFDVVPDDFRDVLKNLGIENLQQDKKLETEALVEKMVEKQHVFNPDSQSTTEEELKKLDKLFETIKQLEKLNGTATEDDLKNIDLESIKELVGSFNNDNSPTLDQKNSPNPINFDFGVSKNEIKRQEDSSTTTTTTTTTEEPRNPPLADLEASFGGQSSTTTTTTSAPETTTRIFTGFYRLVDWNTFFDIDDQKGRRVNLRFQPKVGDPKRFLSVTVP